MVWRQSLVTGIGKAVTSFWCRVGLSLSALALLLTRVDGHEAARSLASVDLLYFLAAMVADVAARTVMIGRWVVLLRAGGQSVSTWSMARIFFISSFVSTALPTGSADVIRACALSQSGVGGQAATASVVVDGILGVVSLLLLGLVSLASGIPEANLPPLARLVAGLCLVASVVVLFGALWTDRLAGAILPQPLRRSAVGQWLLLTAGEIASYRSRRGVLIGVLGLCLAVQWLRITRSVSAGPRFGYRRRPRLLFHLHADCIDHIDASGFDRGPRSAAGGHHLAVAAGRRAGPGFFCAFDVGGGSRRTGHAAGILSLSSHARKPPACQAITARDGQPGQDSRPASAGRHPDAP